jgi:predicted phage terminase large subunit-like protein
MVTSPTYGMLSDSTFRSFLSVAEELGVVHPSGIHRAAPPSVKLLTGAEFLFRSCDNPDALRGPNLSGAWMDEASYCDESVFDVLIGRLREGGEQGFLLATFTPRGRRHWSFQTFGTGRPNTELITCASRENPFLPKQFVDVLKSKYTSAMQQQELEGQFVDLSGQLFQRSWFPIVDALPRTIIGQCRAWDLAASDESEKRGEDSDFTAGVKLAKGADGILYITDIRHFRGSPQRVEEIVRTTAHEDGIACPIFFEQDPGSAGKSLVSHYQRFVLPQFNLRAFRLTGSKVVRAQPVAARAEAGHIKVLRGFWNQQLLDEIEGFPHGKHDDLVDSLSLAHMKITDCSMYSEGPSVLVRGRPNLFDPEWDICNRGRCGAMGTDASSTFVSQFRPQPF